MDQDHESLAQACLNILHPVAQYFIRHVKAEQATDKTRLFLQIFRPASLVFSGYILTTTFQVGSAVLCLSMSRPCGTNLDAGAEMLGTDDEESLKPVHGSDSGTDQRAEDTVVVDVRTRKSISWNPFYYIWAAVKIFENDSGWFWRSTTISGVYYLLQISLVLLLDAVLPLQQTASRVVAYVLVSAALAPLHLLWAHSLIISSREAMHWSLTRIASAWSIRSYKSLALPSLLHSSTQAAVASIFCITISSLLALGWNTGSVLRMLFAAFTVFALAYIPAAIVLTRVEVALLPSSERTVVPVDCGAGFSQGGGDFVEVTLESSVYALWSVERKDVLKALGNYAKWTIALVGGMGSHAGQ